MGPLQCRLTIFKDSEGRRKVKYDVIPPYPVDIVGDLCDDELTKDTVKRLNRFIGYSERVIATDTAFCEREDLQLLGRHLHHILFQGTTTVDGGKANKTLADIFIETYKQFEDDIERTKRETGSDPDFRFRVTLIFEEGMDELAGFPWEFLYIPKPNKTGFFLAGEKAELILTRFVPELGKPKTITPDEKLIILIAWSKPRELGPVSESGTIEAIQMMAANIKDKLSGGNIEVIPVPNATHSELKHMIETTNPHIVHFIGHGKVIDKENMIALMKTQEQIDLERAKIIAEGRRGEPKQAHWVNSASIRALFLDKPPRLVFLHACKSDEAPSSLEIFKSAAQQVLRANVPFVIAMQHEISNEDATFFAETFYEKLCEGMSIDEAVKAGRIELGKKEPSWGHPRFGTPVAYLQSEDCVIVKKEVKESEKGKDNFPVFCKHNCPYPMCEYTISPDQKRCSCDKHLRLKQCLNPKCQRANPFDETMCIYCETVFDVKQSIAAAPMEPQRDRGSEDVRGWNN